MEGVEGSFVDTLHLHYHLEPFERLVGCSDTEAEQSLLKIVFSLIFGQKHLLIWCYTYFYYIDWCVNMLNIKFVFYLNKIYKVW